MATWTNAGSIGTRRYQCGYCENRVASKDGYFGMTSSTPDRFIYICPECTKPSFFDENDRQIPLVAPGNNVRSVPEIVEALYRESRHSCTVGAYTASVLSSRKILMNIAVDRGAQENQRFIEYVEYLADTGYVPPNGKHWVDHIRAKGNEATHEIAIMSADDAAELITLIEMLLKFIYEFPARVPSTSNMSAE